MKTTDSRPKKLIEVALPLGLPDFPLKVAALA